MSKKEELCVWVIIYSEGDVTFFDREPRISDKEIEAMEAELQLWFW